MKKHRIAFFGTSEFSIFVLEELKKQDLLPDLIVTIPDKPQGRKLVNTPPPVKIWANKERIPTLQPDTIKTSEFEIELKQKGGKGWDLFVVASYGKLIPENILYMPKKSTLNVHPSLLPLLRGAAPLERSILADMRTTGVTIIRLDKEMDHGPIIAQEKVIVEPWPLNRLELEKVLGAHGGDLLGRTIPKWLDGLIPEIEQNHHEATYAPKITKEESLIDMNGNPRTNLLKIKAFTDWPKTYFLENGKRIVINDAHIENGKLVLLKVTPEGRREMSWKDYLAGKN